MTRWLGMIKNGSFDSVPIPDPDPERFVILFFNHKNTTNISFITLLLGVVSINILIMFE